MAAQRSARDKHRAHRQEHELDAGLEDVEGTEQQVPDVPEHADLTHLAQVPAVMPAHASPCITSFAVNRTSRSVLLTDETSASSSRGSSAR